MYSLTQEKRDLFLQYVSDVLVEDFNYANDIAKEMVDMSALVDVLDEMPEFVLHYSVKYWAKQVIEENTPVCV